MTRRPPRTHATAVANLLLTAGCLLTSVGTVAAPQGYPPPPGSYDSEYTLPHPAEVLSDTMQAAGGYDSRGVLPGSAAPPSSTTRTEPHGSSAQFGAPPAAALRSDDSSAAATQAAGRRSTYASPASGFLPALPDSTSAGGDYRDGGFRPPALSSGPDYRQAPPAYPRHQTFPGRAPGHAAPPPARPGRPTYRSPADPATVRVHPADASSQGFYPGPVDAANRPPGSPQAADGAAVFRPVN